MSTKESLKTHAVRAGLTPIDRACVRLAKAMGYSGASAATANLVSQATVVALTKGLTKPLPSGEMPQEARQFILRHLAADTGLDAEKDSALIEDLMGVACQQLAVRIEAMARIKGGQRRFGLSEAA